jgi:DNA-binding winged helix-turn-helix (wHTH) protein/tetratricopeptide (TPR) repeat protein
VPITPSRFRFGPFIVERPAYRVLRDGHALPLSPKLVDLLLYFVSRPSVLVTKDELFAAIWPDVTVTENALTQAISDLRQALGDEHASPTYIQTVARRGYRFIAPVEALAPFASDAPAHAEPVPAGDLGMVRSVAVLDFANLSADPELGWLATGIPETVTNDLTGFRVLRVVDRVRIGEAVRRTDGSMTAVARELDVHLVVVGSFQRAGDRIRITARLVDLPTGATVADAKVDGRLEDIFDLQDRVVRQFSAALGVEAAHGQSTRMGVRETSNLDAFRAASEARVKLDSFAPAQIAAAAEGFERAVRLDPRYALAYAGLANAHYLLYEATRARNAPDAARLATAIGHARRCVDLEDMLAEGHATLAFLLVSAGRFAEAVAAGRRAVALEPQDWRHLFRLGHAAWGSERLDALKRALTIYSDLAFAHFYIAMVHIARSQLPMATEVLHQGVALQDKQAGRESRYPASGLHWLLGMVYLAQGDAGRALSECRRELEAASGASARVYGSEFAMNAHDGCGFALLAGRRVDEAAAAFTRALRLFPGHARSQIGLAQCLAAAGKKAEAQATVEEARASIAELGRGGRLLEAALLAAMAAVAQGRPTDAIALLDRLLTEAPPGFPGWTIPIEPMFKPLHNQPEFAGILARLAERAR